MARADTSAPSLGISQLKVSTSGQFITLYNSTANALDLSRYQLEYFNSYDLTKASSSKLIALSGTIPPHGYYVINDGTLTLCYQLTVESVSLGLSTTAGMLELIGFNQAGPGATLQATVQDYVGWSKTLVSGVQTLPANANSFLARQPLDSSRNPQIPTAGAGSWLPVQPDTNPCNLISASGQPISLGTAELLPSQEPAASIVNLLSNPGADQPVIPAADNGLISPKLTELLPNPDGTGNDSTDEFIELYNPNSVDFDLSGFQIQTGLTTTHRYAFPAGTSLPASSFTAFYSAATKLSLSNTSSQVVLLNPLGNPIDQSDVYNNASDGQAWALANGNWYWTTTSTPNSTNVITQLAPKTTAKSKTSSSKSLTKAKASTKTKKITPVASKSDAGNPPSTPVQTWLLALIGGIALLYGAYEYRQDLANRVYQLRRYLSAGRQNWPKIKRRRGD